MVTVVKSKDDKGDLTNSELYLLLIGAADDWIRIRDDSGTGESRVPDQ
jgi:hypothetical protein